MPLTAPVTMRAMESYDIAVIGAGAAGMMCAIEAGKRGRSVLVVDHAKAPGEKIRISGGGRCNFTNLGTNPANFISNNSRFAISALSRYSQRNFIALVGRVLLAFIFVKAGIGKLSAIDATVPGPLAVCASRSMYTSLRFESR